MCAVIFPFIRRLFSSFVLTCFLWTTLFQTIAFAEFERVIPEHAFLEREAGTLKTIRLNIGVQSFDSAADATHFDPLIDAKQLDIYADMLRQTTDLFIPFEESFDKTQESLDHIYKGSTYEGIKISEDGIKWTAHGYNYHMHNSGHMCVSANTAGLALSRNLKLSNPHGAIFLEGDLDFDTLSLDTKDVVQHGNLNVRSLTTKVAGKLINSGFMSVSELLFDDIASAERDTAPLPLFINTHEGHFEGKDLSITGACIIQNDGQFTAYGKTHFSFHGRVENNGTMTLDGELTNHNKIDVDELGYEGKKLVNKKEAVIEANHYSRTAKLDHLLNQGRLIVRQGGFEAQTIDNERLLSLGNGKFSLSTFNNTSTGRLFALKGMLLDAVSFLNDAEIISREDMLLTSDFSIKDNSLTILRWNPFYPTRKIGRVRTKGNMAIRMRDFSSSTSTTSPMLSGNVAEFLQQNQDNFFVGKDKKVIVHAKSFIPTTDLKFGHHVEMHVDDYQNDRYLAAFSALDLFTKTFRNGKSNDEMGSLKTLEPEHVEDQPRPSVPAHKYHMNVTVDGDVDNRYGILFGAGPTEIVSRLGDVLWGESVAIPNGGNAHQFFRGNYDQSFTTYKSNASRISSNHRLIVRAVKGKLKGTYGELFSSLDMHIKTDTCDQKIETLSTQFTCGGRLTIESKEWTYNRTAPFHKNWGNNDCAHNIHSGGFVSNAAKLTVHGNFYLNVDVCSILANDVFVSGSLFLKQKEIKDNFRTYLNIEDIRYSAGSGEGTNIITVSSNIRIGEHFDVNIGSMRLEGRLSARIIDITTNVFSQGGHSQRAPSHMTGIMLENGLLTTVTPYAKQLIGGMVQETENRFIAPTEDISYQTQIVSRQNVPVLDQPDLGFRGLYFVDRRLEMYAFMHMYGAITGRMYDPWVRESIGNLAQTCMGRAQDMVRRGTFTRDDLDSVTKTILFYQRIPEQQFLDRFIPEHAQLMMYTPNAEIMRNLGASGIFGQRVTINAREAHIDGGAIVQEAPLEDIMDEPEKENISTARAMREDDSDKDVDVATPKTKVRKPKAKTEPHPLELNFGSVDGRAANWLSDDGIKLTIEKGGFLGSKSKRMSIDGGFQDVIERFTMRSKGPIHVKAEHDLCLQAIEAHSDTSILFETSGNLFDIPLMLEGARTKVEHHGRSRKTIEEHWSTAMTSNYTCKGAVVFKADGRIDTYATKVRAKLLQFLAGEGVRIHDVQNSYSCATKEHTKGKSSWGGLFGGKDSEIYSSYQRINSVGMDAGDTPVEIILGQRGSVDLTNVSIKDLVIDPKGGTITFHLSKSYESFQRSEKSEGMWYKSQSMHMSEHQTGTQSRIGNLKVISAEDAPVTLVIEEVRGRTAEFLKRIELDHGTVTQLFWEEVHNEVNQKAGGITAACGALIAIAVGAVTFGTGAAMSVGTSMATSLGSATGLTSCFAGTCMAGAGTAMFAAGFTSLCTSAALSLANNGFDPAKSAKAFASVDTLQSTGMSMLLAGMTHGALQKADLATDLSTLSTLEDFAANQGVNMAVKTSTDLAFTGRTDGIASTLGAVAGTIGGYVSNQIGTWYKGSEGTAVEAIAHKLLHSLKGAGEGVIVGAASGMDSEILGKAVAGAAGAFIAETTADILTPTGGLGDKGYDPVRIRQTQAAARIITGAIAIAAGMSADDIGMAIFSANTSLDHNFAASAKAATNDPDTDDEAEVSTVGKGRRAVLKALGVEKVGEIINDFTKALHLDTSLEAAATRPDNVEGGEAEYVAAHLKWTQESVFKRPLTPGETAACSAMFKSAYAKGDSPMDMAKAFGTVASAIGKGVDVFLRYTGLTDKGTARAIGNSVNDGLAVVGAGAALKGVVKGAAKSLGKGAANSQLPTNYERIVSQIPGRVISEADALNPGILGETLDSVASTFSGGRYAVITLEKPFEITRVWAPGQSTEFGACWGIEKTSGSLQSAIDKAILPEWGKIKEVPFLRTKPAEYTIARIPAGKQIYVGEVSSQGGAWVGGTSQVIVEGGVEAAWKIGGGTLK